MCVEHLMSSSSCESLKTAPGPRVDRSGPRLRCGAWWLWSPHAGGRISFLLWSLPFLLENSAFLSSCFWCSSKRRSVGLGCRGTAQCVLAVRCVSQRSESVSCCNFQMSMAQPKYQRNGCCVPVVFGIACREGQSCRWLCKVVARDAIIWTTLASCGLLVFLIDWNMVGCTNKGTPYKGIHI